MTVMETIYFLKTYSDYHSNGANRSYWAKFFRQFSERLQEKNKMRLYSSFNENMPIYEYYSEKMQRSVRIMQYNPQNEIITSEKYKASRFYTAWIDERVLSEDLSVPELVVCLLMTKANIEKTEELIDSWISGHDDKTRGMIEKVYENQERMDKEQL